MRERTGTGRRRWRGTLVAVGAVAALTMGLAPAVGASVTKPGPPTAVKVTPGNGSGVVAWSAPKSDGGSAITGYTAKAEPGGKSCSTTGAKTCTVFGLTDGGSYSVTVTARNAKGQSPASASAPVVVGAPLAPTRVMGTPGVGEITVSWTAPVTNGSPITRYSVTMTPGSKTCATKGRTSCTLTGLTDGTAYRFTVAATNRRGTGPASKLTGPVSPGFPGLTRSKAASAG
ncbi:MAG: fibronectin type III domain-containing protein [Acidimicrobiales bacterium]